MDANDGLPFDNRLILSPGLGDSLLEQDIVVIHLLSLAKNARRLVAEVDYGRDEDVP